MEVHGWAWVGVECDSCGSPSWGGGFIEGEDTRPGPGRGGCSKGQRAVDDGESCVTMASLVECRSTARAIFRARVWLGGVWGCLVERAHARVMEFGAVGRGESMNAAG